MISGQVAPIAGYGPNGICWGKPAFTTVYVWVAPLISIVQAVYSGCNRGSGVKGDLVAVVTVDFDFTFLSETLRFTSPSDVCQSSIVQQYGEVLAADDFLTVEPDSDGGYRRLIVTNSALEQVSYLAQSTMSSEDDSNGNAPMQYHFLENQNVTLTHGSYMYLISSAATWETYYSFIPTKFSTWSALRTYPREIFYSELDNGTVLHAFVSTWS